MKEGPFEITYIRFRGIGCLVEQTEQKFRRIQVCLKDKKRVTVIVGFFYSKSAD